MSSTKSTNVLILVIIFILSAAKNPNANERLAEVGISYDQTREDVFEFIYLNVNLDMTTGLENDYLLSYLKCLFSSATYNFNENTSIDNPIQWCEQNISSYVKLEMNTNLKLKCDEMMTHEHFKSTFDSYNALYYAYFYIILNNTTMNQLLKEYLKHIIIKFKPYIDKTSAIGPYAFCVYLDENPFDQNNTDVSTQYSNEPYQSEDSDFSWNFKSFSISAANEGHEPDNQYEYDYNTYQTDNDSSVVRDDQYYNPYAGHYNSLLNTLPDSQYNNIDDNQSYEEPYQSENNITEENIDPNIEKRSVQSLPVLKNGSKFKDLKYLETRNIRGDVIFSNTCAFDSITTIIMVSYCDSQNYSATINSIKSHYFKFVSNTVKHGITSSTYTKRADIILRYLKPTTSELEKITLINCETTAGNVVKKLMINFPSLREKIKCSVCSEESKIYSPFITYQTNMVNKFSQLQQFLNERSKLMNNQKCMSNNCGGFKKVNSIFSNMHLFIDVLHWEDNISSERTSEAAMLIEAKLCDIPQVLYSATTHYELRGVISFRKGESDHRNAVGHYTSYARRHDGSWELYDDLNKTPLSVESTINVLCELLIYTI